MNNLNIDTEDPIDPDQSYINNMSQHIDNLAGQLSGAQHIDNLAGQLSGAQHIDNMAGQLSGAQQNNSV